MNWSKSEINSIKIALSGGRYSLVEDLSSRLGVDKESIRGKIREIELKQRIRRSAEGVKDSLKEHRGRRFRKYGGKLKERFRD